MDCIRKITGCALLSLAVESHAAFNGISDHSRANCVNNESITWDYTQAHRLAIVALHTADYMNRMGQYAKHRIETIWETTRRSAAVHWGEGKTPTGYYLVQAFHWEYKGNSAILRANTSVDNCSLYNGWWDW